MSVVRAWLVAAAWFAVALVAHAADDKTPPPAGGSPGIDARLWRKIDVPGELLSPETPSAARFAGDLRIGDLDGDAQAEFVVCRSAQGGMKPCFLGAFDRQGRVLWHAGSGGGQPARPAPVTVYDLGGDGAAEVVCFFVVAGMPRSEGVARTLFRQTGWQLEAARSESVRVAQQQEANRPRSPGNPESMADVVIQIRDGRTGRVLRQAAPEALRKAAGSESNWLHQRILVANFRGGPRPRDFVVKLGATLLAFDERLQPLWTYAIEWNEYGWCSAYVPAVGDMDRDGRDEVNGGYYVLDSRGRPRWEKKLGPNMDSVAIAPWDGGTVRAICSGAGHVLDADGRVVLALGERLVPHGQEVRVADLTAEWPGPEMVIRFSGHEPDAMLVTSDGLLRRRFRLNPSPNHTGMEAVFWRGSDKPAMLYNGGWLWDLDGPPRGTPLPGLPKPIGAEKMGWYHCLPADVCSDSREEVILYNPWDRAVWIYTPAPIKPEALRGYRAGPRQYNARIMD